MKDMHVNDNKINYGYMIYGFFRNYLMEMRYNDLWLYSMKNKLFKQIILDYSQKI